MSFIKIGYFRVVYNDRENYLSYEEFRSFDEDTRAHLCESVRSGDATLFCACKAENINPLTITSLGFVRVANNGRQEDHAESCPKSASYAGWAASAKKGVSQLAAMTADGEGRLCFNFSLPPLYPSKSSAASSSPGTGLGIPREKKIPLLDLVTCVNKIAWLHQTYSIKKKIAVARKEGRDPEWEYKDFKEFGRLFFATCKDIYIRISGQTVPLYSLCYRKNVFDSCQNSAIQFFIYVRILKIKPFNAGRKYQYVTVEIATPAGDTRAAVRILTNDFVSLFGQENCENFVDECGGIPVLAGFVRKVSYLQEDGRYDSWMTLVRGVVIMVTENGLSYENENAGNLIRELCRQKVIFQRPYMPLENFGSEIPTVLIDRFRDKTLVLDCPSPDEADTHAGYGKGNEEFDIMIIRNRTDITAAMHQVLSPGKSKNIYT